MRTPQQSTQYRIPRVTTLIILVAIALFGCSQKLLAQQKDGEGTTADSNTSSTSSGRVNFNIIQLLNGEYLEMFGTGTGHGILRGHPTISGVELGTLSADPLMFSTNSTERMRILSNGFIGIGTTNPITPFELHVPDANPYQVSTTSTARMRLVNSNTTNNNAVELNLSAIDSNGVVATGVRLVGIFTNHATGAVSADMAVVLRNAGNWSEAMRFATNGNIGIGNNAPTYKLDVAGPIRSTSGGFIFPDGTVQTTAGAGGDSQWSNSGSNIYYNAGNVGLGTSTPGVALDVSQNRAIRVGNANLSSGGDYVHLATHAWFDGTGWQMDGAPGALYEIAGQTHSWWKHSGTNGLISLMYLTSNGNLGIGTTGPTAKLQVHGVGTYGTAAFFGSSGLPSAFNYGNDGTEDTYIRGGKITSRVLINEGTAGNVLLALGGGNVGIATTNPGVKLDVAGQIRSTSGGFVFPDGTMQTTASGGSSQWTTSSSNIYYTLGNVGIGINAPSVKLHVAGDGRFTGNLVVDGNLAAKYQDMAEWVPTAAQLSAGTVVILDVTKPNQVTSSSTSYDTRVAGVVSERPGITLGEKSDNKLLIATTGRVRVKVDATNAPIQIGDLLVTSDREGFAMKSLPLEMGGSRMHRPGTLIGKALEPLAGGIGEILVLLSLQ